MSEKRLIGFDEFISWVSGDDSFYEEYCEECKLSCDDAKDSCPLWQSLEVPISVTKSVIAKGIRYGTERSGEDV